MVDVKKIEEVKRRLIQTYNPLEIYIFGSYAWGHPDEESDLDILVVVDSLDKDRYRALVEGYRALMGMQLSKDILLYTKEEFNEDSKKIANLCYRIKHEGKQIYARA